MGYTPYTPYTTPYRARGPAAPVCWPDCEPTRATLHNCVRSCTDGAWHGACRHARRVPDAAACNVQLQRAYHYVGGSAARTLLRRARPSLYRQHGSTAARRLVHSGRTPHRWRISLPRISTTYAPCGETSQTTYCYDGRTNTYTKGRVAGPSHVTSRHCYIFVVWPTGTAAARAAGTAHAT